MPSRDPTKALYTLVDVAYRDLKPEEKLPSGMIAVLTAALQAKDVRTAQTAIFGVASTYLVMYVPLMKKFSTALSYSTHFANGIFAGFSADTVQESQRHDTLSQAQRAEIIAEASQTKAGRAIIQKFKEVYAIARAGLEPIDIGKPKQKGFVATKSKAVENATDTVGDFSVQQAYKLGMVIGEATSAIYSKLPEINKIPHIGNSVKYLAGAGIISALYILSYSNASKIAILSFNVTVQLIDITIHLTMLSIVGFMDGASRNMTNSVDQKEQLQYHLSTELIRNIAGVGERGASVIQSIYESYQMQRDVIKQVDTALKGQEIEEAVSSTPSYISKVWQLECKKAMLYIFGMSKEGQLDNKSIRVVDEVASAFSAAIKSADSGIYAMVYRICFGIGQERAAHLAKDQGQTSAVKI